MVRGLHANRVYKDSCSLKIEATVRHICLHTFLLLSPSLLIANMSEFCSFNVYLFYCFKAFEGWKFLCSLGPADRGFLDKHWSTTTRCVEVECTSVLEMWNVLLPHTVVYGIALYTSQNKMPGRRVQEQQIS